MNRSQAVEEFLSQKTLAIVGASRDRQKYGNIVYRNLRSRGFQVFPVNPKSEEIEGDKCYPDLPSLPEKPDGIVIIVPPVLTKSVVQKAHALGIKHIWMQPGAESEEAVRFCLENDMNVIYNQCILMTA